MKNKKEKLDFDKVWLMFQDTDRRMKETDKQIKELGKQIGGLHNSIGEYSENFLKNSVTTLLKDHFKVEAVTHDYSINKKGKHIQIDAFGYSNNKRNEMFVLELKTKLRPDDIDQLDNIIKNIDLFLPEHKDKKVYGIMAAVNYKQDLADKITGKGYYFAHISGDMLVLDNPKGFKAKAF